MTSPARPSSGARTTRTSGARTVQDSVDGTADDAEARRFILANLPPRPVPGVPEVSLHLAAPTSALHRLAKPAGRRAPPYWAYPWAGGLALARHVLAHPQTVAGLRVLDLGAGSGLVGIAAAMSGARRVFAVDIDPVATCAIALNAAANAVAIDVARGDPTRQPPPAVDVVLVGDLFYERALARRVTAFLDRCQAAGGSVLVGDPWRPHLPRRRLRLLAEYRVADFGDRTGGDGGGASPSGVFALEPPRPAPATDPRATPPAPQAARASRSDPIR